MASRPISPAEPTKQHPSPIQPNAHPYAIKTTSSALLSRSNSSPHSANPARHHYVPSSPSQVPTVTRGRHRHSSSLSSVRAGVGSRVSTVPAPLPAPPSVVATLPDVTSALSMSADEQPRLTHRRRAETMPSNSATTAITGRHSHDQQHKHRDSTPELYANLPSNLGQWNMDELSTYLETSLRSVDNADGDKHDSNLVDVPDCVRTRGLTGRELLRLTDADLVGTPLSDAQCAQFLKRSRTLRADALRGRVPIDSYHLREVSDNSNAVYSRSARSSTPSHSFCGASVSVDDLRLLPDDDPCEGEHTSPLFPAMSLHRSNSTSDASAQRYKDLARMRIRRRGKVKGLVETWERASTSGSEYSTSEGSVSGNEAESESETDLGFESILGDTCSPEFPSEPLPVLHDEPPRTARSSMVNPTVVLQEPSSTPPPPYTHVYTTPGVVEDEEKEPSIEELLASSLGIPLTGAHAWEADIGLGETVKRIPVSTSESAGRASPLAMEADTPRPKIDTGQTRGDSVRLKGAGVRRSTGSRGKSAKAQKRVVTAIFTGSASDTVPEHTRGGMNLADSQGLASKTSGVVRGEAPARSEPRDDSDRALKDLEESIAETRAQMEAFRLRLEVVEADTARREAELERAQCFDSPHSSGFKLRWRGSEANEQAALDTAELPMGETPVEGFGNKNVHGGWETMSMGDIAREIVAKAMGWVSLYEHMGASACKGQDRPQAPAGPRPQVNDSQHSLAKRRGRSQVARLSCSMILVSFAICAAVLRRFGFVGWVRRP